MSIDTQTADAAEQPDENDVSEQYVDLFCDTAYHLVDMLNREEDEKLTQEQIESLEAQDAANHLALIRFVIENGPALLAFYETENA